MKADLRCLLYLLHQRAVSSPLLTRLSSSLSISIAVHLLLLLVLGSIVVARRGGGSPVRHLQVVSLPVLIEDLRPSTIPSSPPAPAPTETPAEKKAQPPPPGTSSPAALPGFSKNSSGELPPIPPHVLYGSYLKGEANGNLNFFGLSPRGKRIVFVVDISGSMLQKTGPQTRLSLAMQEIKKAVGRLEPSQQFSVVLFAETVAFFRLAPVAASTDNKVACFRFLDSDPNLGGSTNLEDGLVKALAMKPDVILLLTDGEANTPARGILAQVRFLREKLNHRMQIHSVGYFLDTDSPAERMLKTLSEENNGVYQRWNPG